MLEDYVKRVLIAEILHKDGLKNWLRIKDLKKFRLSNEVF